ncbi:MAG: hypothetical protein WBN40_00165 [Pseudomonadales bacterium]
MPGSDAIAAGDLNIQAWVTAVTSYNPGSNVDLQFQDSGKATGPAGNSNGNNEGYTFDIVSLGRNGSITLAFDQPIANGGGFDFAVFENSFADGFLELAWVEVSSNGIDFIRFDGYSLTPGPVGPFSATMDATNLNGLAGKYRGGWGTPFDLELVKDSPNLDVNAITHLRLVDIVGDGLELDSLAAPIGPNPIYDPYPTSGSAGFDLDAVAILNQAQPAIEQNVPIPNFLLLILAVMLGAIARVRMISSTGK